MNAVPLDLLNGLLHQMGWPIERRVREDGNHRVVHRGADTQLRIRQTGVNCIAGAEKTQQRILCIPLLCEAFTTADFSTLLGKGN